MICLRISIRNIVVSLRGRARYLNKCLAHGTNIAVHLVEVSDEALNLFRVRQTILDQFVFGKLLQRRLV